MLWSILQVFLASLCVGVTAGWVMHRADFCTVAALRDSILLRDTSMFRAQLLLVSLSVVLFGLMSFSGMQAYSATPFFGLPSYSNILGGVLFGFGMVLAGGCVVGVLYRLGSGSWIALSAFTGLVAGSAMYAEVHPLWRTAAQQMVLGKFATLPQLTGLPLVFWVFGMALCSIWLWRGFSRHHKARHIQGFVAPHHAALALALCGTISLLLVGMPLGVTTSYAKFAAMMEQLLLPHHVTGVDFFVQQPFVYTPPFSTSSLVGGGGWHVDAFALIQFPLIFGVLFGAFLSAWRLKEFRVRFRPPKLQLGVAFIGGFLMGIAARITPGCNVWHVWGGLPHLALSSLLFFVSLIPGAWLGARIIQRVIFAGQEGKSV